MAVSTISRGSVNLTDDSGSGTDGTVVNAAWATALLDAIDALFSSGLSIAGSTVKLAIIDDSATGNPQLDFAQTTTVRSSISHQDSSNRLKLDSSYGDIEFFTGTGGSSSSRVLIDEAGLFGIGTTSPAAQLHVAQASTSGAAPVVTLDQADVDEDYFKFIGTSDTSADRALVDAANFTTPGAIAGWLKINVQDDQGSSPITDGDYYLPFYAVPTA